MTRQLVHYISPFGSPAWMPRPEAERYLKQDDDLWLFCEEVERETGSSMLTERQREVGPPRIEVGR